MKSEKIRRIKRILICVLVACILLFIDHLTKLIAQSYLRPDSMISIIPGWVGLTYSLNDAIAFSVGSGNATFMMIITALVPIFTAAFVVLALTVFKKNMPAQVALFVIASGALGNFLDRLFIKNAAGKAAVRDFMYLKFFNVCNFADFCITLGAVALIFIILFIGPSAVFPLKKSWREEQKREEAERKKKKYGEV